MLICCFHYLKVKLPQYHLILDQRVKIKGILVSNCFSLTLCEMGYHIVNGTESKFGFLLRCPHNLLSISIVWKVAIRIPVIFR